MTIFHVELGKAVERQEMDLVTRYPYYMNIEERRIEFLLFKNVNNSKVVIAIPNQELTDMEMEEICSILYEKDYSERIVYTNEKRYSLGHGVKMKDLP